MATMRDVALDYIAMEDKAFWERVTAVLENVEELECLRVYANEQGKPCTERHSMLGACSNCVISTEVGALLAKIRADR